MSGNNINIPELKRLYSENRNIMALFREWGGTSQNSPEAILVSYDLQSGSYAEAMKDPAYRRLHDMYSAEIATIVSETSPISVLEAGIGEATTLCSVLSRMYPPPRTAAGFDIAWSRVNCAQRYAEASGFPDLTLSTGDLSAIPFADNSFDVVYTAHAMEPNHGREEEILRELCRVARHRVVLCEPSYELGGEATKKRIEEHGYCRNLPSIARKIGAEVVIHRLLENPMKRDNATAVLAIQKTGSPAGWREPGFACPCCHFPLEPVKDQWFCGECSLVYPVIAGIPCLLKGNGILATHFPDQP